MSKQVIDTRMDKVRVMDDNNRMKKASDNMKTSAKYYQNNELFKLNEQGGIMNWLENIKLENIARIDENEVFMKYQPLEIGNDKLANTILSFSLLPVTTCGQICKGCYDLRSMRYTGVRAKRYVNTSKAVHDLDDLEKLIVKQVLNSKTVKYVRIHVGGDMFSINYVQMWQRIVKKVSAVKPSIIFYTYTKTVYTKMLRESGINVVNSMHDGKYNFGSIEYVKELRKQLKEAVICPATILSHMGKKVPSKFCGSKCTLCMRLENVLFVQH